MIYSHKHAACAKLDAQFRATHAAFYKFIARAKCALYYSIMQQRAACKCVCFRFDGVVVRGHCSRT